MLVNLRVKIADCRKVVFMSKMRSRQKRLKLIELRGKGVSYSKIAEELNSSKTTVIRWSRELQVPCFVNIENEWWRCI